MKNPFPIARHTRKQAFTLMEVMIAVAIMSLVLAGLYSLLFATQQLWSNGFAISKTGMETRKIYDRMVFSLYQSPGGIAEPMSLEPPSAPVRLDRTLGKPSAACVFAMMAGGPLEVVMAGTIPEGTKSFTLRIPVLESDHEYSIAARQDAAGILNLRVGDYMVITSSSDSTVPSSDPRRISAVTRSGNSFSVTLSQGFSFPLKSKGIADEYYAASVIRYSAYVVLENLAIEGDVKNALVEYNGLEVAASGGVPAISSGRPYRMNLPANYRSRYDRLVSSSLIPYPFTDAAYPTEEGPIRPFYRQPSYAADGSLEVESVRVRFAIASGDVAEVVKVGDMSRFSNFDSEIFLRSGSF